MLTTASAHPPASRYDVAIVGQGVVGQFLALRLAQRGHRVVAIERREQPYDLPRAVHFDPDVNRALASVGVDAAEQRSFSEPATHYSWLSADRRLLLDFASPLEGDQGWPGSSMFNQPGLEAALRRRIARQQNLDVLTGHSVTGVRQDVDEVRIVAAADDGSTIEITARYVVGCDGARSTVRDLVGLETTDLGFFSDWLVVDLLEDEPRREWTPENGQICDPARPTTVVSGGPGRRRFEFMLMPGEDPATFGTPERATELLEPWDIDPATMRIERVAIYRFNARWAPQWRANRVFLAGDAAHLMPPFFGQGMVSGVRDAVNLAWKLDFVLSGAAPDSLLDSYGTERSSHVQHAIGMSVELGRVICETDPEKVRARDEHLLAVGPDPAKAMPPPPPERLGPGYFPGGEPGDDPVAGVFGVQGRVRDAAGTERLLDEHVGGSMLVLVDGRHVGLEEAAGLRAALQERMPARIVRVVPPGDAPRAHEHVLEVADLDDRYVPRFTALGVAALVERPDFHGFGSAGDLDATRELLDALAAWPAHAGGSR